MNRNHGGDWAGYAREYGMRPLDFSASVSPLGMPEGVRRAVIDALADCCAYPDPQCTALRQALGQRLGLPPEEILCGNGASDLIYRLAHALAPGRALVTAPAFSEYEAALLGAGWQVTRLPLDPADFSRLPPVPPAELLFLCNPNNPTGRTFPKQALLALLERCRREGTLLVMDECFLEFLEDPAAHSLLPELGDGGLLILRAFTKFYGMAGLRLGYCMSGDRELLARMTLAGPPWPVSHGAQAGGIAALGEEDYALALRELIRAQRPVLIRGLEELGFRVIPGEANFLLFRGKPGLAAELRRKGILIRDCGSMPGLSPGWYRIAVRRPEENQRLLEAVKEVLAAWQNG